MAAASYRHDGGTPFAPIIDALLVAGAGWLAYHLRWDTWQLPFPYLSVLVLGTGLVLVILPLTGAYRLASGVPTSRYLGSALPGLLVIALLLMAMGTLTKTTAEYSRLWMGYWLLLSAAALLLCRSVTLIAGRALLSGQRPTRRVLLVGDGPFAASVAARVRKATDADWRIVGLVAADPAQSGTAPEGTRSVSLAEMQALTGDPDGGVDEVWIALEHSPIERKRLIMELLQTACITVRYIPDLSMMALLNQEPSRIAGMMVIDLNSSPLDGPAAIVKSVFDRVLAALALAALAPLLLVIAAAIRADSRGPVFFRQQRLGSDGRVIQVLKFRTMYHTAPDSGQARRGDPRVTGVGRWLRRSSLDEIPQLINVLRGDMSLVGPRPHPLALNREFERRIEGYMQRHRVRPGITGWAQVHGLRGETETLEKMQQRIEYDLYYIKHWSLWLDIKILALTLVRGWSGANAY